MRRAVLLATVLVLISPLSWASDAPFRYVDGTLSVPKWTPGFLDRSDEREFEIRWANGKDNTFILYRRIIFVEFGAYAARSVLEFWGGQDKKPHKFLTLVYLDDWQHTQILEFELKRDSDAFADSLRQRTEPLMRNSPHDATSLTGTYGPSLPRTSRRVKVWSSTLPGVVARAPALLEVEPAGAIILSQGSVKHRIESDSISSLEFDDKVGSGALRALLLSAAVMNELPLMMMTKKINHLLSVTLVRDGIPQAVVLELPKYSSRAFIIELEMRLGKKVEHDKSIAELYG